MTNKEKLIKLYNKSLGTGKLPRNGLCKCLRFLKISRYNLNLFEPYNSYLMNSYPYWGIGTENQEIIRDFSRLAYDFTPLRQTILGFLIAMED